MGALGGGLEGEEEGRFFLMLQLLKKRGFRYFPVKSRLCVFSGIRKNKERGGPSVHQLALHKPPVGMDDCGATGSATCPQNIELGLAFVLLRLHLPPPVHAVPTHYIKLVATQN